MKTRSLLAPRLILAALLLCPALISAQELKAIKLPAPQKNGGIPLMQALNKRQSSREYSSKPLPRQVLSNLLWAAWGINRSDSGKRTAPSSMNWQEMDVYVAMADGLYLYNAKEHQLDPVLAKDIRAVTGKQDFVKDAPVNLIFVSNLSKMPSGTVAQKEITSNVNTGFISQNVYLYCASEGLATVVRGWFDSDALAKAMGLKSDQKAILSQTVGYPKE